MKKWLTTILLTGLVTSTLHSATFYVDQNARGHSNGQTWNDAWTRFASIQWQLLQPGDTLKISGGKTEQIYYEQLDISQSGSQSKRFFITGADESGHNGKAIIDGGLERHGIVNSGHDFVTVQNLALRHCLTAVRFKNSEFNTISNLQAVIRHGRGISLHRMHHTLIQDCYIISDQGNFAFQTDGIYMQFGSHNTVDHNTIIIRNNNADEHCDCVQLFTEDNPAIINNYLEQDVNNPSNNNGIWSSVCTGDYLLFNNILYTPGFDGFANTFGYLELGGNTRILAFHNTFLGHTSPNVFKIDDADAIIKNNLFAGFNAHYSVILENNLTDPANMDYNCYAVQNASGKLVYTGEDRNGTLSELQTRGYEIHGRELTTRPFMDPENGDFSLKPDSDAIDAGCDLTQQVPKDRNGIHRSMGQMPDCGALEYVKMILKSPSKLRFKKP